jgi:hypothetical protein
MTDVSVKGEHLQKQTLTVQVFIPDHPDRTTTPIFAATRRKLIEHNPDACCEICGTKDSLELHHQHVEWCDSTAVDWDKVSKEVPEFDWVSFDQSKPETFIDSEWNARLVLCKKHHTGLDHGIHMLPYPLFLLQKVKKADFIFSPDEAPELPPV